MLEATIQPGDGVEHRGIVITPLFGRRTPVARYATLEDALALGLRIDEVSEAGVVPRSRPTCSRAASRRARSGTRCRRSPRGWAFSETGAQADVFGSRAVELGELEEAFPLQRGQCGALLALGDDLCLDFVSRPEAFARLYPKLRAGYLLDALERLDGEPTSPKRLPDFVAAIASAAQARQRSAGLGDDVRLRGERVVGSVLELDGELLQLSAFAGGDRNGQIARPSRRRLPRGGI